MGDKVYGFCGTNKCKREVISASDKVQIEANKIIDQTQNTFFTVRIAYPEGFNMENTFVESVMMRKSGENIWKTTDVENVEWCGAKCYLDYIELGYGKISSTPISSGTYTLKALLMKGEQVAVG